VPVNPQEPVLAMLNHARATEMPAIRDRTPAQTAPGTGPATDRADEAATRASG